jgi:FixJ family two-component response regulator
MAEVPDWIALDNDEEPVRRALVRLMRLIGVDARLFSSGIQFLDFIRSGENHARHGAD